MRRLDQRGDTLIEVIVATALLSLIIVLAITIMNGGTLQSQRAVEETFVRQEIDSQADLLRMARDAYDDGDRDAWRAVTAKSSADGALPFDQLKNSNCIPTNARAFYMKTTGSGFTLPLPGDFSAPQTFASAGKGVWIEATAPGGANYVDFYIYGCWTAPASGPKATSGTVVRLYAPQN